MGDYYKLEGHKAVPCELLEWAKEFQRSRQDGTCYVARDLVEGSRVSTVFLGIDHSFGFGSKPLLFETMVFGGALDGEQERYETWDEAVAGHEQMVERVREAAKND